MRLCCVVQTSKLLLLRLAHRGRLQRIRPLRVRDAAPIDRTPQDIFKALVEERRRYEQLPGAEAERTADALKVVANSLAYGIWAELNRQEPTARPTRLAVDGLWRFYADVAAVEDRGEYFFAPIASLVAGGGRLMLAILERLVTDAGGIWVTCDTDGLAVVSTRDGGLVPVRTARSGTGRVVSVCGLSAGHRSTRSWSASEH